MLIITRGVLKRGGGIGVSHLVRFWSDEKPALSVASSAAITPLPDPLLPDMPILLRNTGIRKRKSRPVTPTPAPSADLPNLFVAVEEPSLRDRLLLGKDDSQQSVGQLPFLAKALTSEQLDPILVVECEDVVSAISEINKQLAHVPRLILSREDCHLIHALLQAHQHGIQLPRDCWDPLPTNLLSNRSLRSDEADQFEEADDVAVRVEDEHNKWKFDAIDEQIRNLNEPREWRSLHGLIRHHHNGLSKASIYRYALEHTRAPFLILEGMPHDRTDLIAALRSAGAVAICLQTDGLLKDEASSPTLHPACNHLQMRLSNTAPQDHRLKLMRNYRLIRDLLIQLHVDWRQLPYLPVNLATSSPTLELIQTEMPCLEADWTMEQAMGIACLVHGSHVAASDRLQHLRDTLQQNCPVTRSLPMPNSTTPKSKLPDPESLSKHERRFLSQIVTPGK